MSILRQKRRSNFSNTTMTIDHTTNTFSAAHTAYILVIFEPCFIFSNDLSFSKPFLMSIIKMRLILLAPLIPIQIDVNVFRSEKWETKEEITQAAWIYKFKINWLSFARSYFCGAQTTFVRHAVCVDAWVSVTLNYSQIVLWDGAHIITHGFIDKFETNLGMRLAI